MKSRPTAAKQPRSFASKSALLSTATSSARDSSSTSIIGSTLSRQELTAMIATEAYFRAEKRGFAPGGELDDWLAAERAVASDLSGNHSRRDG